MSFLDTNTYQKTVGDQTRLDPENAVEEILGAQWNSSNSVVDLLHDQKTIHHNYTLN